MKTINISEYTGNCFLINFFYSITFVVIVVIIVGILVSIDPSQLLIACFVVGMILINAVFYILFNTKLYWISLLGNILVCIICFYFLLLNLHGDISVKYLILEGIVIGSLIGFTYLSIASQRKLLKLWKNKYGIQHSYLFLKYKSYKISKFEFLGENVARKLFLSKLPYVIVCGIVGFLVFTNISNHSILRTLMLLVPVVYYPILTFLRSVERKIVQCSSVYGNHENQENVITILRSHVFDDIKVLIKDNTGFSSDTKVEFMEVIIETCSTILPPAYLPIRDDYNFCLRRFDSSVSDEKHWLDSIEDFTKKAPLIILILGKIIDGEEEKGLKQEIELIDKCNYWNKILLLMPPVETSSSQVMWNDIKNNILNLQNTNLSIKNKTIGYMFNSDRTPKLELQANEKDKNSYEDTISIAASILL